MDVTRTFHTDSTKRQIMEGLEIENTPKNRLMNSKSEWNTPSIPQCVVRRLSEREGHHQMKDKSMQTFMTFC